jgi:phosphoenolpyruvate phosphomutase
MLRASYPAMVKVAECILENERSLEADDMCMPIKQILTLIPEFK